MFIIEADSVTKRYHNHTALDNVSVQIPESSIFGLLGPNGAGKTSLIRIINQITFPDEGKILFKGRSLMESDIKTIGYLPEERGLYRKMEVGEQALYLARLKGLDRSTAMRQLKYWFEKFDISPWWKKKVEELSKGMAQKVQFIVTVLHDPDVLILDEPFSGFDPINANLIKNEVLEFKKKGKTIIFSTHNMASVEEMCGHICLINNARVVLSGSLREIKALNKTNLYEVEMGNANGIKLSNTLGSEYQLVNSVETEDQTVKYYIKMLRDQQSNQLLQRVMEAGTVVTFREISPTMNDIFIKSVLPDDAAPIPILTE